jgi:hypothetical protein
LTRDGFDADGFVEEVSVAQAIVEKVDIRAQRQAGVGVAEPLFRSVGHYGAGKPAGPDVSARRRESWAGAEAG